MNSARYDVARPDGISFANTFALIFTPDRSRVGH
jgi:hypothetical protein